MVMGNGEKDYYSAFFWEKMVVLVVAFIYTFTIRRSSRCGGSPHAARSGARRRDWLDRALAVRGRLGPVHRVAVLATMLMNRNTLAWILGAIAVLGVAALTFMLGRR